MSTLHEDQRTFMVTSCGVLLRTRNVSDKSCRQDHNTHFRFHLHFSFWNHAVYGLMW